MYRVELTAGLPNLADHQDHCGGLMEAVFLKGGSWALASSCPGNSRGQEEREPTENEFRVFSVWTCCL